MFKYLTFILSIVLFQQGINLNEMKKDHYLVEYKKLSAQISNNFISGYFKVPANYSKIQKEVLVNPSRELFKKRLKEEGMIHADEFVDGLKKQSDLMVLFLKNHTEINNLNVQDRTSLITKLLTN